MADKAKIRRLEIITNTMDNNTFKAHTKYAHTVRGRPALKDVEGFLNGLVHELYERSFYFIGVNLDIENHATSTLSMSEPIVILSK